VRQLCAAAWRFLMSEVPSSEHELPFFFRKCVLTLWPKQARLGCLKIFQICYKEKPDFQTAPPTRCCRFFIENVC